MRGIRDTIVLDDGEWYLCPSEVPIVARDFGLTKVQGRFDGEVITGIEPFSVTVI